MASPRTAAITGAGTGIGLQLALALAARGTEVFLCCRREKDAAAAAERCSRSGAMAHGASVDVRDAAAVRSWIALIEKRRPLDLLVVNAGIFAGRSDPGVFESPDLIEAVISTNLTGAIHSAAAAAHHMAARGTGHIALISSLAALAPSADAQAYSASKAGLSAYGEALREDMAGRGVTVSVIHPGHVLTRQTEQQSGPVPLAIEAGDAARRILRAIDRRAPESSFPFAASFAVRVMRLLPWRIRARLNAPGRFTVQNPEPISRVPPPVL